ncbi:hypothetical protein SAMN05518871_103454 [Psychrobacillus sp. OK028]|uniref:hypothetical protein n=1 Tax=Psychrobacillus sp. OK028 TaxID=1884359 RepID=UPI000880884C|nr:hypothetical protein [Psychrobacillus sp. OK028]SDN15551.1 hypothetical protein SAMN05518871_103454 [Psychrobacillus sp. OK028]
MKRKKLLSCLLIGVLLTTTIISVTWAYNLKQELDSYRLLVINSPENLITQFEAILAYEEEIVQNQNDKEQEQMLESHVALTDALLLHMNTMRGILMREINPRENYSRLEDQILKEMANFREFSSQSDKSDSIHALKNAIEEYKEYIIQIKNETGIEEEVI